MKLATRTEFDKLYEKIPKIKGGWRTFKAKETSWVAFDKNEGHPRCPSLSYCGNI
jgi:hypothetical protein